MKKLRKLFITVNLVNSLCVKFKIYASGSY
jgi:hypothetical protein